MFTTKPDKEYMSTLTFPGDGNFGYEIKCTEESTTIIYYEYDEESGERTREDVFDITIGYDLYVFKEAIRLRTNHSEEENKQ